MTNKIILNVLIFLSLCAAQLSFGEYSASVCNDTDMTVFVTNIVKTEEFNCFGERCSLGYSAFYSADSWYVLDPQECESFDSDSGLYVRSEDRSWQWFGGELSDVWYLDETPGRSMYACIPLSLESRGSFRYQMGWAYDRPNRVFSDECENSSDYRPFRARWLGGEDWNITEDNADIIGTKPPTAQEAAYKEIATTQVKINQVKKEIEETSTQIGVANEKIAKCDFNKLKALLPADIVDIDPEFLRKMGECHSGYQDLAKKMEEIMALINKRLKQTMGEIEELQGAVDQALRVAGVDASAQYSGRGLEEIMLPKARHLDGEEEEFYVNLTTEHYQREFLSDAVSEADYEAFLVIVSAWAETYEGIGASRRFSKESSFRKLSFMKAVHSMMSYFEEKAPKSPANPVPDSVKSIIETQIKPRDAQGADNLSIALRRWRGETPSPIQSLVLDTTLLVGGGYASLNGGAADPIVQGRMKALVVELSLFATALSDASTFLPNGDFLLACEMATAKDNCYESGADLSLINRLTSSAILTQNRPAIDNAYISFVRGLPVESRASLKNDKPKIFELMEKLVVVK